MRSSAFGFLMLLCLCPASAFAQSTESGQFAYCQVEDAGGHNIWVSQIFPAPPNAGLLALDLANEFHAYVATLGGAGNKSCLVASHAAAEETRAKIAAIMGKRVFGIRVYKWHDVQWTPSAASYARTAPAPAVATDKYVYCRLTDTDARKLVTSGIFTATLPRADDAEHYAILGRYAKAFGASAAASEGVAPDALCIASDTQGEADKSRDDYRKSFPFSGIRKVEMAWTPDPALASPSVAVAAPSPSSSSSSSSSSSIAASAAATNAGATDDVEADFWRRISNSGQAADFEDYLAAYPQGRHAPIARLEARRLRGGAAANTSAPAASSEASPAQSTSTQPIDAALSARIAGEAFFRIPAGTGASAERSGSRTVGTVPVASTTRMQRVPGGNLCRIHNESTAGTQYVVNTGFDGQTWAGMLPLSSTMQSRSASGTSNWVIRTTSIDAIEGQPFPLVQGHTFGYSFTQSSTDGASVNISTAMSERCVVGATGPASATIAGMAGEQTELQCTLTFKDGALKPQKQRVYWYSAVGCFVLDPGSP